MAAETVYYDLPIEVVCMIHAAADPATWLQLLIADGRLGNDAERYILSRLVTVNRKYSDDDGTDTRWFNDMVPKPYKGTRSQSFTTFLGKLHGEYNYWNRSGQLIRRANFRFGKRHGRRDDWYGSGVHLRLLFFRRGKKCGQEQCWWENGQIGYTAFYKRNKFHGENMGWFRNGQLSHCKQYHNGKLISTHVYYAK